MTFFYDKSKGGDTRELQSWMVPPQKKLGRVTLISRFARFCILNHFNFAIFGKTLINYLFYLILEENRTTSFTMTSNFITRDAAKGLHENSNNKVLTIFSRILLDHDLHSRLCKFCLRHPLQAAFLWVLCERFSLYIFLYIERKPFK